MTRTPPTTGTQKRTSARDQHTCSCTVVVVMALSLLCFLSLFSLGRRGRKQSSSAGTRRTGQPPFPTQDDDARECAASARALLFLPAPLIRKNRSRLNQIVRNAIKYKHLDTMRTESSVARQVRGWTDDGTDASDATLANGVRSGDQKESNQRRECVGGGFDDDDDDDERT